MGTILTGILIYFPFSFLSFSYLNTPSITEGEPFTAKNILYQVFEVNKTIRTISYTVLLKERIHGKYIQRKNDFKVVFNPYKIYMKEYYPDQGLEILYNKEETDEKALLNRNSIILPLLRLDPIGNMMRKESHHSIFKGGFNYLLEVLEALYTKYPEERISAWHYEGMVKYDHIICYKIIFDNPGFGLTNYIVKEGENLEIISRKMNVCDYMIFENNPNLRSFDDFKPGTKIRIPADYARQIILYIDKEKLIPIGVKVFDDKGLFDEYTYQNIVLNPVFSDQDFKSSNPAYGFR